MAAPAMTEEQKAKARMDREKAVKDTKEALRAFTAATRNKIIGAALAALAVED